MKHICEYCSFEHDGKYATGRFCSSKCAKGFSTKAKRKEINEKVSKTIKNKLANGERVGFALLSNKIVKICPVCKLKFKVTKARSKQMHCSANCKNNSIEYRKKLSESLKGKVGGYRKGSGRGKSGWYKNYWCDSSWELAWVIYNLEHNISFERNKKYYYYKWNNKQLKYFPDFVRGEELIEIKGFATKKTKAKIKVVPNLKILFEKDIKKELDYVKSKYGNDFIKLYENNPHKIRTNKCKICGKPAKNLYCSRKCSGRGLKLQNFMKC